MAEVRALRIMQIVDPLGVHTGCHSHLMLSLQNRSIQLGLRIVSFDLHPLCLARLEAKLHLGHGASVLVLFLLFVRASHVL